MVTNTQASIISPIALDLGAKSTGVVLAQGKSEDSPHLHERQGYTFIFPENGLELSQKNRLAKRHQRRGFKRRRLSKRLLQVILRNNYSGTPETFQQDLDKLRTFLNRRGYTYLSLDEAQDIIDDIRSFDQDLRLEIIEALGRECGLNARRDFLPQIEKTDERSLDFYRSLIALCEKATTRENKSIKNDLKKKIRSLQEYCAGILKAEEEGHKTRSEYLRNIRQDLNLPEFQDLVSRFNLTSNQLANLIGHIANLQLRVLRRYFNDPAMANQDYWHAGRMEKIFIRYLRSWHVQKSVREYDNRQKVLDYIAQHGVEQAFKGLDPVLTIPPFEHQNNRRPPTCKSLHLAETQLDVRFPEWRLWTKKLAERKQHLYELSGAAAEAEINSIAAYYAQSSTATGHRRGKGSEAIILQRLLDRSSIIDDYKLRVLVQVEDMVAVGEPIPEGLKRAYETGKKEVEEAIGTNAVKHLAELARQYYAEVSRAKRGLWLPEEQGNLLFRCDRKPKQKKNVREELIGHILGCDMHQESLWESWQIAYFAPKTINGRSSLSSVCKKIEETRKDLGDEFHYYWNRIRHSNFKPNAQDKTEKEVLRQIEIATKAAAYIAEKLDHTAEQRAHYENPYSLAQIYNIMEADISGFHKTCPACTRDNFWRSSPAAMGVPDKNGKIPARGSRLPADTMRPFDGFLARYLDRLGEKIAKEKWRQITALQPKEPVLIPILLEENRFSFSSDLAEIKRSKKQKQAKERLNRFEKREHDKWERIRKAGGGICPYTGERIGSGGEFDHILPRSYSQSRFGSVFNSEMNLIYASSKGNRLKLDSRYTLKDLHKNYLQQVFGTADVDAIRKQIKATVSRFKDSRNLYFHTLEPNEQRDFRHALFDDDLIGQVQNLLHTQYKMRVSGLQGYLARVIYARLRDLNAEKGYPLFFAVFGYDAGDPTLSVRRENLAIHNAAYAKPVDSQQSPGSHIIDATMVWAQALERGDIPGLPAGLLLEGDALEELLPDNLQIVSLESRKQYRRNRPQSMPLFKDTIYAERYLSLIVSQKECGFGFDLKNLVRFEYDKLPWVFELIKQFTAFRGAAVTEPLEHYRQLLGKKKKYIYFNIVRERAAEFQQNHAYAPSLTPVESNQMTMLGALRYFTIKKEVFGMMSDAQGKATAILSAQKDREKFAIKVNFSLAQDNGTKALRIAGEVSLPQITAWENLAKDKTVSRFVTDSAKWQELSDAERKTLILRHFSQTVINDRKHRGVRKVYSLPIPEGPSGGFRIQRRRDIRQFHVQAVEGAKFSGFASKNGRVDFSSPAILPVLTKAGSLAPIEGHVGQPFNESVFMDEWRKIPLDNFPETWQGIEAFWLQPNSEPRMRVRLQISNAIAADGMLAWHLTAPMSISTSKKSEDEAMAKIQQRLVRLLERINLKPRDKVNLVAANQTSTIYEFIVQGTNSEMKDWYNLGHLCAT